MTEADPIRRPVVIERRTRIRIIGGKPDDEGRLRRALANAQHRTLLDWIVGQAEATGWSAHWTHDSRHSPKGKLDLTLRRPPQADGETARWIEGEVKTGGAQLTPEQKMEVQFLAAFPWVEVYVWRDGDEQRILEVLA